MCKRSIHLLLLTILCPHVRAEEPIFAVIETTLQTSGSQPRQLVDDNNPAKPATFQIRQFAFDGDPETFYASANNPTANDHFTLVFDKPVNVKSISITTGRPDNTDAFKAGAVEISPDNTTFTQLVAFANGSATAQPRGGMIRAIRIKPSGDPAYPLVVREIQIESEPKVLVFKYPIEIFVDVTDAAQMKDWTEKTARACERAYFMINEELKSDGFKPLTVIHMRLDPKYNGVAAAGGGRIRGSVAFFTKHPDDVGAMVHETVHCVQRYGRGANRNPGWLVEGVADFVRFFRWEPTRPKPLSPERARHNGSYRVTAAFLNFIVEKYDKEFVRKLNAIMRAGQYKEESTWKDLTGKTVQELEVEWKESLKP